MNINSLGFYNLNKSKIPKEQPNKAFDAFRSKSNAHFSFPNGKAQKFDIRFASSKINFSNYSRPYAAFSTLQTVPNKDFANTRYDKKRLYDLALQKSPVLSNPLISSIIIDEASISRFSKYKDHKSFADAIIIDKEKLRADQRLFKTKASLLKNMGSTNAFNQFDDLLEKYFIIPEANVKAVNCELTNEQQELRNNGGLLNVEIELPDLDFSKLENKLDSKADLKLKTQDYIDASKYIHNNWKNLVRKTPEVTNSSLIPLPKPFVIPGGRFREVYYWDSYFTMLGLKESKLNNLAKGMTDNFLYLVKEFGFIPNGNRTYYLSRSQPPFLAMMVDEARPKDLSKPENRKWMEDAYETVKHEYNANWMDPKTHLVPEVGLNRYYDMIDKKRPECFGTDKVDADTAGYFIQERAACESGLDFTKRFSAGGANLLPVDLNALLYKYEANLAKWANELGKEGEAKKWESAATKRKNLIFKYSYNKDDGLFYDYDIKNKKHTKYKTAANAFALWTGLVNKEQAVKIKDFILSDLSTAGGILNMKKDPDAQGILSTKLDSEYQWDEPNGWAPHQYIAVEGLKKYGFDNEAREISKKWIDLNTKVFKEHGKFYEKYNIAQPDQNVRTNYPEQDGFGWTNGVYLYLLNNVLAE